MWENVWNPWHGCKRCSEGCAHCYVFRRDLAVGRDPSAVTRTKSFRLPLAHDRSGSFRVPPGSTLFACLTSDFFLEAADGWREEAWEIMRQRPDLHFIIITKRILRFPLCIPQDWENGYENVSVFCTAENQRRADERLPLFLTLPIRRRAIVCEPLLEELDLSPYLTPDVSEVIAGGESGDDARLCRYEWVLALREQCRAHGVAFRFKQTGARFEKDGRLYRIPRQEQMRQASRAGIDLPLHKGNQL